MEKKIKAKGKRSLLNALHLGEASGWARDRRSRGRIIQKMVLQSGRQRGRVCMGDQRVEKRKGHV
jgi:hypothetical protein